jgi:hypothetical protein
MSIYSIDTCAILDVVERYYNEKVFPGLWKNIDNFIMTGRIIAAYEVKVELEKKEDSEGYKWAQKYSRNLFRPFGGSQQTHVRTILRQYPGLIEPDSGKSNADPFVIALAITTSAIVVTSEKGRGSINRPNIPDVCKKMGVKCVNIIGMCELEGWSFN